MRKVDKVETIGKTPTEGLTATLQRDIAALVEHRQHLASRADWRDGVADGVTVFAGSVLFVFLHGPIYGFWMVANLGWMPLLPRWDPTFVAFVEAIFLSTFVLISQNRLAAAEDWGPELNLQISLLAEHEVTKLVAMTADIAAKLGVVPRDAEVAELKTDVDAVAVLNVIEGQAEHNRC